MKSLHATLSSFAVFALAGCATLQVHTDYDPEIVPVPVSWTSRRPNHAAFRVSS